MLKMLKLIRKIRENQKIDLKKNKDQKRINKIKIKNPLKIKDFEHL